MKLKTRIIISFFIIMLEPLIFAGIALNLFTRYQIKMFEKQYGIENPTYESLYNTAGVVNHLTNDAAEQIKQIADTEPWKFEDTEYLNSLNQQLSKTYSYVLVWEDEDITYYGNDTYSAELVEKLKEYDDFNSASNDGVYLGGKIQALIKQVNFTTANVRDGRVYIVCSVFDVVPQLKDLMKNMVVAVVLILAITALGLTWWVYRGLIAPLDKLRTATRKIKE